MKSTALLSLTGLCVSGAIAIDLVERTKPSVLGLDIVRKTSTLSAPLRDRLRKRGPVAVTLDNQATLYFANVSLGTPPQSLRLDIDTGSSDVWANAASSDLCTQQPSACVTSGTYKANSSSTYQYLNSQFYIKYADNSGAQGDYVADTMNLAGTTITGVTFGIGYRSTSPQGILGVGYASNEASVGTTGQNYQNLPLVMTAQKIINTPAYSLWLNDLSANTGSILFGGVDTDKFKGTLQTLPIIKEQGVYREFIIALTGMSVAGQTVISSAIPVLLDSGSSLTYLPTQYANAIFSAFGATFNSQAGAAVVNCNYMNSAQTFEFVFSGAKISIPMNEMIIVDGVRRGQQICILGISDAAGSTAVLGDTFLRSAYVVYDLNNNQISLAETNFNATTSNVMEITTGPNGIPNASTVTGAVTTLSVSTGGARSPQSTGISPASTVSAPSLKTAFSIVIAAVAALTFVI